MPIFGRRQLQLMLDGLQSHLSNSKTLDLLRRLESEDPDQCLPAEYELSLTWGLSQLSEIEIEMPIPSGAPDIFSSNFLGLRPAYIDIAAVSDGSIAGTKLMRRAANIINNVCVRFIKSAPSHLHFQFAETSGYLPANRASRGFMRFFRNRQVTGRFKMDDRIQATLRSWLSNGPPLTALRVANGDIDVTITWKDHVSSQSNIFSTMPAIAYDARDNPIYRALSSKEKKLRSVPQGSLRGVFLGDSGSTLLRDIDSASGISTLSGRTIIRQFLKDGNLDFVVTFVPRHRILYTQWTNDNPKCWHIYIDGRTLEIEADLERLGTLRNVLPKPRLYGYQARSWHEQRMFEPQSRGHYVPATWYIEHEGENKMTAKISVRALQELIAGRIDQAQFQRWALGEVNYFERALTQGQTISKIQFEKAGPDEDDDYVVIEFSDDPAARKLINRKLPKDNA